MDPAAGLGIRDSLLQSIWSFLFGGTFTLKCHFLNHTPAQQRSIKKAQPSRLNLDLFDPTGSRRKILSVIFEGISIQRRNYDYFGGDKILPELRYRDIKVPLSGEAIQDKWFLPFSDIPIDVESECTLQEETTGWWDKQRCSPEDTTRWTEVELKLPAITKARSAAGHPAAAFVTYSDTREAEIEHGSKDLSEDNLDKSIARAETIRHQTPAEKTARQQFREQLAIGDRWKSSRTVAGLYCVWAGFSDDDPISRGNVLVFSHCLRTLDALSVGLKKLNEGNKYSVFQLDGTMSAEAKDLVRRKFNSTETCSVLLMTYASSSLGLNLHSATKVIFLTPQWSPAVEKQAIARALQAGQTKPVLVYRLWAPNSVEQEVMKKHPLKENLTHFLEGSARDKHPNEWREWLQWGQDEFLETLGSIQVQEEAE
ncbi:hypothetical protein PV11_09528 [Exophiala sideris]|uniref:Helicase C-terminal domain-containing protein n=1 Tax=Exophiala sideris TaxID=1016849 RepID=A0A0D1Y4I6_9EURO|nr:hypothetical protein PV11_09528 [Exophiala sideris]